MKYFKKFLLLVSIVSLTLVSAIYMAPVSADYLGGNTSDTTLDIPSTIEINGVEKNVKIVTWEEYHLDVSGDFLVVISDSNSQLQPASIVKKVAYFIGNQIAGYIVEKGIEVIVSATISAAKSASAAGYLLGLTPWALMVGVGLAAAYMIWASGEPQIVGYTNFGGCRWSGPNLYNGQWICPMYMI